jgi:hypothetical protein
MAAVPVSTRESSVEMAILNRENLGEEETEEKKIFGGMDHPGGGRRSGAHSEPARASGQSPKEEADL